MSAPYARTQLALDEHLNQFAAPRALIVRWENQPALEPPREAEWLWPTFMPASSEVATLSQRLIRATGLYQVNVFCPEEEGSAAINQTVDSLLEHFAPGMVLTSGSQQIKLVNTERKHGRPDGNGFFLIPAIVHWVAWAAA